MLDLLVTLLVLVLIFGVILYIIQAILPLDPALKNIAVLIVGVIFILWLLFAVLGYAPLVPVHRSGALR